MVDTIYDKINDYASVTITIGLSRGHPDLVVR